MKKFLLCIVAVLVFVASAFALTVSVSPDSVKASKRAEVVITVTIDRAISGEAIALISIPSGLGKPSLSTANNGWVSIALQGGKVHRVGVQGQNIAVSIANARAGSVLIIKYGCKARKGKGALIGSAGDQIIKATLNGEEVSATVKVKK